MHNFMMSGLLLTLIFFGCQENEKPFKENVELKAALTGKWRKAPDPNSPGVADSEVIFADHTMHWYDSAANIDSNGNGEIQTVRGQCPVKYTFRDGIQYYNPDNLKAVYLFSDTNEDDLLWVFTLDGANSIIVDYTVVDNAIITGDTWQTQPVPTYITSCFVLFKNDGKTAEFCHPSTWGCVTYNKVN